MKQFDTWPIRYRRIEHIHEGVWLKTNNFWQNDSYENLDNYSLILLLYMHGYCLLVPINSYHSNLMERFILCQYNTDTLQVWGQLYWPEALQKEIGSEKIIFVFSKLRSAGLNYNLPSFFTDSYYARGGGGDLISIAYWLCSFSLFLIQTICCEYSKELSQWDQTVKMHRLICTFSVYMQLHHWQVFSVWRSIVVEFFTVNCAKLYNSKW